MTLTPRLIAIQGIGLSPIAMAVQGLYGVADAAPTGGGSRHTQWMRYAIPHRRPRKRRQDDILFL
jgi:hypothetical protein